ncbi:LPS export ABC transporter periplasmic protein LptC [Halosquirtibacter xylanolyticus]|uniref:LPS export ABC transporter periplasmic protein LptC n=1 Tax=Halosquirtibacter xylanolyticus TaxID=3374599 RepID=UPI00374892A0|nr:LPS export ABC transporter periplasmic protein LptC [Prolixibacteraceae bacterium]
MLVIKKYRNMVALLTVVSTLFLFSCKNTGSDQNILPEYKHVPISTAENFEMTFTDSARVTMHFTAPVLVVDTKEVDDEIEQFKVCPKGFIVERFNNDGVQVGHISADYGKQEEALHRFEARGNVIVSNDKGDTLKTEHLIYLQQEKKIYSDVFVKIIQKDRIITGDRFESDENFENRVLYNSKIQMDIDDNDIQKK